MQLNVKHIWWDVEETLFRAPKEYLAAKEQRRYELFAEITRRPLSEDLKRKYKVLFKKYKGHSAVFQSLGKTKNFWQDELDKIDITAYLHPDQKVTDMFSKFSQLTYTHSIFTNRTEPSLKQILKHLQIPESLFTHFITNKDIVHPKPHPEGFQRMVALSRQQPDENLFVADTIEKDILPAKKVGMKTVLVWSPEKQTDADVTLPHVWDVISLFT